MAKLRRDGGSQLDLGGLEELLELFLGYPDGDTFHANSMATKKALLDQ